MYKFLIPLFALALLIGCTPATNTPSDSYSSTPSMTQSSTIPGFDGKMLTGKHMVTFKTTMGNIDIELDADKAPKTVTNFVVLARMGYYNGLTFHRVIDTFMIQGGDPNGNGTGGASIYGESFEDEPNDLKMDRGMIAMANRGPNTNGSQFFIIQSPTGTPWLQGRHTIFGKVTKGMEVVDKIAKVKVDGNDMPMTPITYDVEVKD